MTAIEPPEIEAPPRSAGAVPLIDIFGYRDYRAFLRDHYVARKARGRAFSYRAFSRKVGLKSPNYLKLVIDGERNLSMAMAERFGAACQLTGDALRYFVELVAFAHGHRRQNTL